MSRGDGLARLTSALEDRGCTVRGGEAQCPAHEDTRASLSVGQGRDGALVKCHAGCELDAVLEALGMSAAGLFDEPREPAESRGGAVVAATYTYTDEDGAPLFYAERLDPKGFRQYRIVAGVKVWKLGDVRKVPYRLPGLLTAAAAGGTVYVVEGEKDVHAIEAAGAVATCNPMGAGKWRAEYARYFTGAATVIIVADRDEAGRKHAAAAARSLRKAGVTVEIVEPAEGKDAADHLGAGHGLGDFRAPVQVGPNISGKPPRRAAPVVPAMTMPQVEAAYARWLNDEDPVPTRVTHAVHVANVNLDGDPVWVVLVGGSGWGKTERIVPLSVMPEVVCVSTVTGEAALLSATPRRERAENATGGLLRRVGDLGVLAVKDFTSILEMDRTDRGKVLAALREVYDGQWDRDVGAEGGQTLTWKGKCGFLTGCTTAIDRAHSVVADMGPRSLFLRLPATDLGTIATTALDHAGQETAMRANLADATAGILTHLPGTPHEITADVKRGLVGLAILASQARSPVFRDWGGEIELVGDAEAPTRIIKQLGQVWRACGLLGLPGAESWEVVQRLALDSIPKLRGAVVRYLAGPVDLLGTPRTANTTEVRIAVSHPHRTVVRALEDLNAHHVIDRVSPGKGHADMWSLSERTRAWMAAYEGLPEMLGPTHNASEKPE